MPTALEISILETLALLDGAFREFAEGVADDRYAVWLGAGISVGKLPGLEELAEAVLEHLRVRVDLADADCRWRNSIDRILGLIGLTDDEWKTIDYTRSVAAWPDLLSIRRRLVAQYARMLDETPMGEPGDYLVWAAVEVVRRYADPAITPGPEHLGLAALILDGAVSDIASANWDPLVCPPTIFWDNSRGLITSVKNSGAGWERLGQCAEVLSPCRSRRPDRGLNRHATRFALSRDDRSERAKTVRSKYPQKSLSDNRTKPIWEDGSETALYRGSGRLFKPRPGPSHG
jgi:hypothetical protein